IFFIVTTSFVKEIAIDVSRPSTPGETTAKLSEIIAVQISASGEIRVQDRLVDIRAIRANIEAELIAKPDTSVVVIASREANAGLLVTVIDQARVAGADKVLLAEESG
ncbi:MAG: biopolymer transporter ExbD, partial [Gammaproteobacteria bacterium]|nr:biopolymer transporter ExbD [Gammaproteobacteria bacterium]